MPFAVGETIGPYRIMDQLGQGGMATVFKAYHPALDRFVAIKAMDPVFSEDPSFLARFQREAQVVARLDHPNIVPVYDYSEHERRPYLVMRYIPGETLKARLSRGRLSHAEVTLIVQAVADALAYAHSQGVLHRDIKPSNVLLSEGNRIYLADFGLARIAQAGQSTLSSDVMLGTPQYISPEQARGNTDLDEGTDIYSFGVMLYEIVTGQVPFNADTPYSIVHDHIYSALPPPRSFSPEVSPEVETVLLKALAKERRDRFAGVSDLGIAFLQAWESARPAGRSGLPPLHNEAESEAADAPGDLVTAQAASGSPALGTASGGWDPADRYNLPIRTTAEGPAGGGEAASLPITTGDSQDRLASQVRERLQSGQSKPERAVKRSGRRRRRWWLLVPALLAVCICGFIGLAAIQGMAEAGEVGESNPTATAPGAPSGQVLVDGSTEGRAGGTVGENQVREGAPAGSLPSETPVEAAQRHVNENPADPAAYLNLALAYLTAGNYVAAHVALDDGAAVAGEPYAYYAETAGMLAGREHWLLAAEMYLRMAQAGPGDLAPEVRDQAEMAVYLGSGDPGARVLLNLINDEEGAAAEMKDTLEARFLLYQGHPDVSRDMVGRVLEGSPGYGPALLLQAEVHLSLGEEPEAVGILERLAGGADPRPWVAAIAGILLGEIKA